MQNQKFDKNKSISANKLQFRDEEDNDFQNTDLSPDEINQRFQLLLEVDHQNPESEFLSKYFWNHPFIYDPGYVSLLMKFFEPQSQYGIKGVNSAARIFASFFHFKKKYVGENAMFVQYMNDSFYQIIWNYFTRAPYVMGIFEELLKLEYKLIKKGILQSSTAVKFLLDNKVFDVLKELLKPDYSYLDSVYSLVDAFHYYNCIRYVATLIPKICELTFNSKDKQHIKFGILCLETFGNLEAEIGLVILNDPNFIKKCGDFEDIDTLGEILRMIDFILRNPDSISENEYLYNNSSLIRTQIKDHNSFFLELIFKVLNVPNVSPEFIRVSLAILSHLYLSDKEVGEIIQIGFAKHLFDMIQMNIPFKAKISTISALGLLVECSNKEEMKFFIENGFINIISDFIDDLMNDIPHQIIDALEAINRFGETQQDCTDWNSLIFDNEPIVTALEKAENDEYRDPEDYMIPLIEHATSLLSRRYNEYLPENDAV